MKVIGITGGIGAGKSAVLKFLADNYKCEVIMADDVAKGLYYKGSKAYEMITLLFGDAVLDKAGEINKKALADIIFANANKRAALDSIVHPLVKQEIINKVTNNRIADELDYTFVEAALLIDDHYDVFLDEVWYIDADEDIRRKRLKENRGYPDEKIDNIFASQKSKEELIDKCDYCIDNSGDINRTFEEIRKLLDK